MTDDELRAVVRDAVARYVAAQAGPAPLRPAPTLRVHPSQGLFRLPAGSDLDGPCLIEPGLPCSHCGYCQSFGH